MAPSNELRQKPYWKNTPTSASWFATVKAAGQISPYQFGELSYLTRILFTFITCVLWHCCSSCYEYGKDGQSWLYHQQASLFPAAHPPSPLRKRGKLGKFWHEQVHFVWVFCKQRSFSRILGRVSTVALWNTKDSVRFSFRQLDGMVGSAVCRQCVTLAEFCTSCHVTFTLFSASRKALIFSNYTFIY